MALTTQSADIAAALERLETAVEQRPGLGIRTTRAVTTITDGLCCTTTEGRWTTTTDLAGALGGTDTAPPPGALVRAALGSCLAMTYRLRAAHRGVDLRAIEVTVEGDSNVAGMLGCDPSTPPGFTGLRYHVVVESAADEHEIRAVLAESDQLSPVLDDLRRAMTVEGSHTVGHVED